MILILLNCLICPRLAICAEREIFSDQFKGVERILPDGKKKLYPDGSKWAYTFWPGVKWPDSYGDGTNWLEGNGECQTYVTPFISKVEGRIIPPHLRYDPFSIRSDGLHITAGLLKPEQQKAYGVSGARRFGSGLLLSRFQFTYGTIRMTARLPSAKGSWPALWLLPASHEWPPEIDIFEGMAWGRHANQIHSGLLEPKNDGGTFARWYDIGVDPSQGFHEYELSWTKEKISMRFDGRQLWERPTPKSMHQDMYILVNLAVGGKWPYNELGIKPIDSLSPKRLEEGSDLIEDDYPATMIVQSISVTQP